jgi:hypothetical protein
VEELAFDDDPCIRKGSDGTRYMLGYTISGRYLFVVYALKEKGIARVVKAMDMDDKSRRLSVHQQNRVGISRAFIYTMDSQTAAFSIGNFGVFRLIRKTLCIAYE